MCGICGIVSKEGVPDPALVKRMMARLAHRGPDGSGYYRDANAALGHTRLAIIDAAGGVQPLCNEDGRLWISFNGEIFNYLEIRKQLEPLGHVFKTISDTEVIVHAFEQWGVDCFRRFNGQWAISLWDAAKRELVLSRDPAGIVPLHYAFSKGRFLWASEAKALFADRELPRAFDPAGLDETFTFWCTVAPRTVYAGVCELEPGMWARFRDGRLEKFPYWSTDFPKKGEEEPLSLRESGQRLRSALVDATRLRFLRSDVPVGAYLSGGIDSSVTSAIIRMCTNAPLRTFSLRFSDVEFDETPYQEEMAERLGAEHVSVVVSTSDIARAFPDAIWHGERPILRSAPAPLFLLSRLVRRTGYKVVVTGEGSDEILAGYDIFREAKVRQFWARDPESPKRARAAELLYPWMARSPAQTPSFARAFFGRNLDPADLALSHRPRWDATSGIKRMLRDGFLPRESALSPVDELISRMPVESHAWDSLSRAQWLELTTILPGYILSSQGDRMLMGNSVEGRFPFLDPGLMRLAHSLPPSHKLLGLDEKHILKREFADLVPQSILKRPKQPYRSPDAASFFNGEGGEWIEEVASEELLEDGGVFDPAVVAELFEKCRKVSGERMSNTDNQRVLAVLSTQLAYWHFIKGDGSGDASADPPEPMAVFDDFGQREKGDNE